MRTFFLITLMILSGMAPALWSQPSQYENPVIPGFHPDPSICRVGEDYYLVTSSFEWFPGIPIFHSRDLVNWHPLGHVLTRPSQLRMESTRASAGIWAPTIRYHDGKFWVVVTCKQCTNDCNCGFNFYVTAEEPEGPWSDPIYVKGAPGIDPTLFWDDDGKGYYVGSTHRIGGERRWPGEDRIYIQELDTESGETLTDPVILTTGHATDARFAEGPHIYKRNGKYLLMISEGGTWNNHAVTLFEADSVTGPYRPLQANPVLTNRHLGRGAGITTVGHADLVETQNGEWWAVCLGVRPVDGHYYLGRETFLVPFHWEGITPVFNFPHGRVTRKGNRPDLPWSPLETEPRDEFDHAELAPHWNFLRTPEEKWYRIDPSQGGSLQIRLRPGTVKQRVNPSLIARRFRHHRFRVATRMDFLPRKEYEEAGLVAIQNDRFHYRLVRVPGKIRLYKTAHADRKVLNEDLVAEAPYDLDSVILGMDVKDMEIRFWYGAAPSERIPLGGVQDARILSSTVAGGFTGAFTGMYGSSNGMPGGSSAVFRWFEYRAEPELRQGAGETGGAD